MHEQYISLQWRIQGGGVRALLTLVKLVKKDYRCTGPQVSRVIGQISGSDHKRTRDVSFQFLLYVASFLSSNQRFVTARMCGKVMFSFSGQSIPPCALWWILDSYPIFLKLINLTGTSVI